MRLMTVVVLAGSLMLTGCVGKRSGPPVERTTVEVDNQGFADMTVYVVNGAQRVRLGTALGLRKTVLTIPPSAVAGARDLQFLADPIGSDRRSISQSLYVRQGDSVRLVISP